MNIIRLFFLCLLLGVSGCSSVPLNGKDNKSAITSPIKDIDISAKSEVKRVTVELVKITDGDTIEVLYNGKPEKVRFLLVDTPETSHPRLEEQPYGKEAKSFTKQVLENAEIIELETDIGPNRDKFSRLLGYIFADGKMLQEELLENGLARVAYVYPPNTRYVDQFKTIQKKAQKQGIGIWEYENYSQEDGFHPQIIEETNINDYNQTSHKVIENRGPNCNIKGNINSKGEKIYHTTESQWYTQTKAEVWFCTVHDATQAGFRSPKN